MNIVCLIGPVGCGKSTYMDKYNTDACVKLFPGRIFRGLLGERYFLDHPTPNDPIELDKLLYSLVQESVWFATSHSRTLVIDGFPRSPRQVDLLTEAVRAYGGVIINVDIIAFVVSEAAQLAQCRERNGGDLSLMDQARITKSRVDFITTLERLDFVAKHPARFGFKSLEIERKKESYGTGATDQDKLGLGVCFGQREVADTAREGGGCGP